MKTRGLIGVVVVLAAAALILCAVPSAVRAQQARPIELTFGSPYAAEMPVSQPNKDWMEKMEKDTGGRVHFKTFWGGTVIDAAEGHTELAQGAADVGEISVIFARSGYYIAKGTFLFNYGAPNQQVVRRAAEQVRAKFPQIEAEYKGLKPMAWSANAATHLITRKPVRKLSDLKGMRIRPLGDFSKVFAALGAEVVQMPGADLYVALQKGIIDGAMMPGVAYDSFHLDEVAKYITMLNVYQSYTAQRAMNQASLNKLPPDIKKIFEGSIDWWGADADRILNKISDDGLQIAKKGGVEFINLSKEDMQKFNDAVKVEALKSAQDLDAKGLPGTQIFNETRRLIEAASK
ncbi:MAG TPA: TRAP transporter substrate-binding protein DctP [Syntrophorhabdaceae bacterium]|nr:TRAP transporter substrate-binding protein DctP [Syntrophorhabdaceae bacterium]